jgi:hypothetical protein
VIPEDNEELLENIDKEIAQHILARLKTGEATASELEAARKYLLFKGYRGASAAAVARIDESDPRGMLDSIPEDVLAMFNRD